MLSEAASAAGTPQCFLLTPKLLPQLTFRAACTVLQILNGPTLGDVPGLDFTTARAPRTRPAPRTRWPLRGFLRASCLVARSPRPGNALGTRAQASACRQGPRRSAGRGAQGHHSFRQLPPAAPRRARCARDRSCCSGSAPCWRAPHRAGRWWRARRHMPGAHPRPVQASADTPEARCSVANSTGLQCCGVAPSLALCSADTQVPGGVTHAAAPPACIGLQSCNGYVSSAAKASYSPHPARTATRAEAFALVRSQLHLDE